MTGSPHQVQIMWSNKTLIAALCLVSIVANPVLAVSPSCCCPRRPAPKRTCCRGNQAPLAPTNKSCCHKRSAAGDLGHHRCSCCTQPDSQPQQKSNSIPSVSSMALAIWPVLPAIQAPANVRLSRDTSGPFPASGTSLLALLCKWLK